MNNNKKNENIQQIKKSLGIMVLVLSIISMCIVKLWFTMLVIFVFAVIVTLITGRGDYCAYYCPMGNVQNYFYEKGEHKKIPGTTLLKAAGISLMIAFWSILVYILVVYQSNIPRLWSFMLQLMLAMMFIAIVAQFFSGKRFFCKKLCPLRIPVLRNIIRIRQWIKN
ncbi:MAG: 4Fe-4S binding protein [bacterium]|nr:4Fe-4S binding protein [bacterium]